MMMMTWSILTKLMTKRTRMISSILLNSSLFVILTLPPYDSLNSASLQHNLLPPKSDSSSKYTLVLDLDETLVHCVMEPIERYDIKFSVVSFVII